MRSKIKKKSVELREICSVCRLPIGQERKGSLTGWMFGAAQCKCNKETGITSETIKSAEPLVVDAVQSLFNDQTDRSDEDSDDSFQTAHHKYRVIEQLGAGGMGMVYKVKDEQLDQIFALKVLRGELAVDPLAIERFGKEVRATQSLSHSNVATIYDSGVDRSGRPFYVMEYVEGQTLADLLREQDTLPLERLFDIAGQICEALSHAHQNGIIHRDLKPSNIMLKANDTGIDLVKVVDFGIAKIAPPPGKDTMSLTKTGEIFGSPKYMSPEQCQGDRLDTSSDVYSLGCLMYECIAGRAPFENANPVKIILSHIYEKPLNPRNWRPGAVIPETVSDVIMNCLEKDSKIRYQSMDELKGDLDRLANNDVPTLSNNLNRTRTKTALKWKVVKYSPLAILALVLLLVGTYAVDLKTFLEYPRIFAGLEPADKLLNSSDKQNVPFVLLASSGYSYMQGNLTDVRDKAINSAKLFEQRGDFIDCLYAHSLWMKAEIAAGNQEQAKKVAEAAVSLVRKAQNSKPSKGFRLIGWWYLPTADNWEQLTLQIGDGVSNLYPDYYKDVLEQLDKSTLSAESRIRFEMRCANSMYKFGQINEARQFSLPLISSWKSNQNDRVALTDLDSLTVECFIARDTDTLDRLAELAMPSSPSNFVIALSAMLDKKPGANEQFQKAFSSLIDVPAYFPSAQNKQNSTVGDLATRLLEVGRIDDVDLLFENAIKNNPNDPVIKLQYSKFLAGRGQKDKVFSLREEILKYETAMRNSDKKNPGTVRLDDAGYKQLIASAYADNSFDEADKICRFVLKGLWKNQFERYHDNNEPSTRIQRSGAIIEQELALLAVSVKRGERESASNRYDQIIADESIETWFRTKAKIAKANLCCMENKNDQAETLLKEVLETDEKRAVLPLANLYESQGRYQEAAAILLKTVKPATLGSCDTKLLRTAMRIFERVGNVEVLPDVRKRLDYLKMSERKDFQKCPTWEELITLSDDHDESRVH